MKNNFEILIEPEIKELSSLKLPDPTLFDFYRRDSNRHIWWNIDVDESLVENSYRILEWNKEDEGIPVKDRKPIKIFINTNGGCLNSVLNFINVIQLSKTPIYTIGMGKCYSAGGLLLMSGHKRYIFNDTTVLIHDGSTGAMGNTGKVIDNLEFTQKTEKRVKNFVLNNTKIKKEDYDKNYRRDWFLFSDEVIEFGIADKIITNLDEII